MNDHDAGRRPEGTSRQWPNAFQRARISLFAYAGIAMFIAAAFWLNPESDVFRPFGAAFYLLAGASSLGLGLLVGFSPTVRHAAIGLQMVGVPIQLATSTESHLPLLATAASIAALVVLKPVFPRLSPPLRKLVLTLHVGFAASWLGAALAMLVLSVVALISDDRALRHHAYVFMHLFDLVLWIPLVLLTLASGLILSFGSDWGLVTYRWVAAKVVLTFGLLGAHFLLIQLTDHLENFWVRELAEATAADANADLGFVPLLTVLTMILFVATLWLATALSIYKPWDCFVGAARKSGNDAPAA